LFLLKKNEKNWQDNCNVSVNEESWVKTLDNRWENLSGKQFRDALFLQLDRKTSRRSRDRGGLKNIPFHFLKNETAGNLLRTKRNGQLAILQQLAIIISVIMSVFKLN
jgi:hypothetical protein